jgi:hypothetical protein
MIACDAETGLVIEKKATSFQHRVLPALLSFGEGIGEFFKVEFVVTSFFLIVFVPIDWLPRLAWGCRLARQYSRD